jgi:hypothetical protein
MKKRGWGNGDGFQSLSGYRQHATGSPLRLISWQQIKVPIQWPRLKVGFHNFFRTRI